MIRAAGRAALAVIAATAMPASGALADGDPASDVLLGQAVYLPYSPVTRSLQARLFALTAGSAKAGYPVRVALVSGPGDLGVVPALFGRPGQYARFLSSEIGGAVNAPVLVVMPAGFGLARSGRPLPALAELGGIRIGPGADGLATAALAAVPRLARADGHPIPAAALSASPNAGAPARTVRHALTAVAVLLLLAAVAIAAAFRARARAQTPRA